MKNLWGASTLILAAFAMGGSGFAADFPVKAPRSAHTAAPMPTCGFYWAAFGGWNSVDSMSGTLGGAPVVSSDIYNRREVSSNDGYAVGGAVGTCVPGFSWLRMEGEISYRRNGVNKVTVASEGSIARNGDISALAAMANLWADYPVASNLTVHAGGGIGAANVTLNVNSLSRIHPPPEVSVDDHDTVFAFQLGAGLAWQFMPNIAVTLDYRYFEAVNPTFDVNWFGTTYKFSDNYQSQSILVGLRGNFAAGP